MCGIAAILNYGVGPAPGLDELYRIQSAMTRRGPDAAGCWASPDHRVQLAHRRLAIIDPSAAGAQPMRSEDGEVIITFNGEIYNYRELRDALEREGPRFRTHTDTEVVLRLYLARGRAMVNQLRGMYAFAVWDNPRGGLLLARDPFGIKPLYYSDDGRMLRAASQVKALLAGGGIKTEPEPAGHAGFFLWGHVPSPYTLYRGIRSLPAGSTLWVDRRGVRKEMSFCTAQSLYTRAGASWRFGITGEGGPSHLCAGARLTEAGRGEFLRGAIRKSVRYHLAADVPVVVLLSAGIDSGTLASVASEVAKGVTTLTLGFEDYRGTAADETVLAEQVARGLQASHHTVWIGTKELYGCLEEYFTSMDQPSIDGLNTFLVSWAASRLGFKVALSGVGADELFGGYPGFRQIPRAVRALGFCARWQGFGRACRAILACGLKGMGRAKYAGLFEYGGTWAGAYLLRRGLFMPWELPQLLDPELAREGCSELQRAWESENIVADIDPPHLKVACLETSLYLRDQLLRDADWAGMAHGVEIRTPYVDVDLVKTVAELWVRNEGPSKRELARTCVPPLPREILGRKKTGFSVPIRRCLPAPGLEGKGSRPELCLRPGQEARRWARFVYGQFVGLRGVGADSPEESPEAVGVIAV